LINNGNLSYGQWLRIIKLFELELSTRKIAAQLSMSYNAVYRAVNTIRVAILANADYADILLGGETGSVK